MEGGGLNVEHEGWSVFGFGPFDMGGCYGMGINLLPLYFYELIFFLVHTISSASDLLLF